MKYILLWLIAALFVFTVKTYADTTNIQMAWDMKSKEWKTLEFITGKNERIQEYTTAKDVTERVAFVRADGKTIMILKDKR